MDQLLSLGSLSLPEFSKIKARLFKKGFFEGPLSNIDAVHGRRGHSPFLHTERRSLHGIRQEDTMADPAVDEREKLMNDYRTKIKEHMEMEAK